MGSVNYYSPQHLQVLTKHDEKDELWSEGGSFHLLEEQDLLFSVLRDGAAGLR